MDAYDKIIREIERTLEALDAPVYARYTDKGNVIYHRLTDARSQLLAMINDMQELRDWTST